MKSVERPWLALLLAFSLGACSTAAPTNSGDSVAPLLQEKNLRIAEEVNQLANFRIRGWQYVDLQHVILEDGPSRRFLLALGAPCPSLETAHSIGFTSSVNTVTRSDHLIVRQGPGRPATCSIRRIYRLEEATR